MLFCPFPMEPHKGDPFSAFLIATVHFRNACMNGNQLASRPACRAVLVLSTLLLLVLLYSSFSNSPGGDASVRQLKYGSHGNVPFPKVSLSVSFLQTIPLQRIIHLDLKGAPPKTSYYDEWFFPFLASLNIDGILLEYEDSFPYSDRLSNVFSLQNGTILLGIPKAGPLLPEGHRAHHPAGRAEQPRNNPPCTDLRPHGIRPETQEILSAKRELPRGWPALSPCTRLFCQDDSICVSDPDSLQLIQEMITQVKRSHPNVKRIHIGSDEAYHVGEDIRCQQEMQKLSSDPRRALEKLKIQHIAR